MDFIELESSASNPCKSFSVRILSIDVVLWGDVLDEHTEGAKILIAGELYPLTLESTEKLRKALADV
jgi:hypothetical protein